MLGAWYKTHLGIDVQSWGGAAFRWSDESGTPVGGTAAWSLVNAEGDSFAPSTSSFVINYRVADLEDFLAALRSEGCNVLEKTDGHVWTKEAFFAI